MERGEERLESVPPLSLYSLRPARHVRTLLEVKEKGEARGERERGGDRKPPGVRGATQCAPSLATWIKGARRPSPG